MTVVHSPGPESDNLIASNGLGKKNVPLDEALQIVGEGYFTWYLTFVSGVSTLAAMTTMQSMFFILPSVGCEIELSSPEKAILGSVTFLGSVTSSNIFGFLVDQLGRRKILVVSTFGTYLFCLAACLSPNADSLMLATFFVGVMLGGIFGLPYVYLGEFCYSKYRSKYLSISSIIVMLGNVYSPCVAWLVSWLDIKINITESFTFTSWRLYIVLNAIPMLLSTLMFFYLPESPKFLLIKGKMSEAIDVLSSSYASNSKNLKNEFPVRSICLDPEDDSQNNDTNKSGLLNFFGIMFKQLKELFTPPLLLYTSLCSLLMIGVIGIYGTVQLWIPESSSVMMLHLERSGHHEISLCEAMSNQSVTNRTGSTVGCHVASEIFIISILIGAASFLFSIVILLLVRKIEPKLILGASLILCSISCSLIIFGNFIYLMIPSLGAIAAILSAAHSIVFGLIVNFFPTYLRATATMVTLFFGRITVPIGGSLLGAAYESHCLLAFTVMTISLAGFGLLSLITPSKKNYLKN